MSTYYLQYLFQYVQNSTTYATLSMSIAELQEVEGQVSLVPGSESASLIHRENAR